MHMQIKKTQPQTRRSLTATLAFALFGISMVILLINSGIAAYTNYLALRDNITDRLQLHAHETGDVVFLSLREKFGTLETSAEFADLSNVSVKGRQVVLENMLGLQPTFRQVALLNTAGLPVSEVS